MHELRTGLMVVVLWQAEAGVDLLDGARPRLRPEKRCVMTADDLDGKVEYRRSVKNAGKFRSFPHGATVAAKYDPETKNYFVDYASLRLTADCDSGRCQVVRHFIRPGALEYESEGGFILGNSGGCKNSIIEGAKRLLERYPPEARQKVQADLEEKPEVLSPLVIALYAEERVAKEEGMSDSQLQRVCPPEDEEPMSAGSSVVWSKQHNQAFLNGISFMDTRSSTPAKIALSPEGLDLVRSAWRKKSYGRHRRFEQDDWGMVMDVGRELLANVKVRMEASQKDWDLVDEDTQEPFSPEALIIAGPYRGRSEVMSVNAVVGRLFDEDRFTICPSLGTIGASGFALFDGTAGDFAAETAKRLVFGHLVRTAGWNEFEALQKNTKEPRGRAKWMKEKACLDSAMNDMFVRSDVELMHLCGAEGIHYAASTGVCAVVTQEHLAVGHL
ncbi:hypothetical protein FOZ63_029221, partial [Perkinsus olseni]